MLKDEVGLRRFEDGTRTVLAFDADRERPDLATHLDVFWAIADEDSLLRPDPKLAQCARKWRRMRFLLFCIFETHHHGKKSVRAWLSSSR